MNNELRDYLEQEFTTFEKSRFTGKFWRTPVSNLKGTPLFKIFQEFSALFPDHPNEFETVFYLLPSSPTEFSILFRCVHFEHSMSEDLPRLAKFIESAARALTSIGYGEVDLLDANSEKLQIRFYSALDEVVTLLKARSSRAP
jgi:hypothetical protein